MDSLETASASRPEPVYSTTSISWMYNGMPNGKFCNFTRFGNGHENMQAAKRYRDTAVSNKTGTFRSPKAIFRNR